MRKEARHTQRRDRASGVPLEILELLPPKTRVCLLSALCPGELPPALCKPLKKKHTKTYPPLSDLRPSPPPPFAPFRAQEFPTLPPKPLKVLPKPEEDKKFLNSGAFKIDCVHNMQSVLLEKNPLRWVSPRLRGFSNNINPWQASCSDSNGSGWPPAWGHCRTCARAYLAFLPRKLVLSYPSLVAQLIIKGGKKKCRTF